MLHKILAAAFAGASALTLAAAQNLTAITNGELHMTSARGAVIEDGTVIIRNGRIVAVGQGLSVPDGARVIDAGGNPVTPGFFASLSGIGLEEIGLDREANDTRADNEALTAALDAVDGFNMDSSVMDITRAGGVTRAYSTVTAGATQFGGCGMVIAMVRGPRAIMEPCVAQSALLGQAGAQRTGGSRPAAFATMRRALEDALEYDQSPERYAESGAENRLSVEDARALAPVATGNQTLLIYADGASDIRRTLDLKARYGLDVVIVGGAEAYRVAEEIADAEVPVIMNPIANLPRSFEAMGSTDKAAPMLSEAGVSVSFYDPGTAYTHNARLLPQLAGNAVAAGMAREAAMRAVTLTPAEIYGVARDLGTLERGKLADIVIWDGDPFEVTVRPTHVFVEGEETSLENRQTKLAERYRDLTRGEKPLQYKN